MRVNICAPGDSSVGIQPIYVDFDLGINIDGEEKDWIRKTLTECFSEIYDDRVRVMFEDEFEEFDCSNGNKIISIKTDSTVRSEMKY